MLTVTRSTQALCHRDREAQISKHPHDRQPEHSIAVFGVGLLDTALVGRHPIPQSDALERQLCATSHCGMEPIDEEAAVRHRADHPPVP